MEKNTGMEGSPMGFTGLVWLSAARCAAGKPRTATLTDRGTPVLVKRHVLLELQWQGRGGAFRHLVLRPPDFGRVLGASATVALFVFAVVVAFSVSVRPDRAQAISDVDVVVREGAQLRARQHALRERAFDLAGQVYERVEQGRRRALLAGASGPAWLGQCPRPPAKDAGNEVILAWLSEQGARLQALGIELAAGRDEMGGMQASAPRSLSTGTGSVGNEPAPWVADMGPDLRLNSPRETEIAARYELRRLEAADAVQARAGDHQEKWR